MNGMIPFSMPDNLKEKMPCHPMEIVRPPKLEPESANCLAFSLIFESIWAKEWIGFALNDLKHPLIDYIDGAAFLLKDGLLTVIWVDFETVVYPSPNLAKLAYSEEHRSQELESFYKSLLQMSR